MDESWSIMAAAAAAGPPGGEAAAAAAAAAARLAGLMKGLNLSRFSLVGVEVSGVDAAVAAGPEDAGGVSGIGKGLGAPPAAPPKPGRLNGGGRPPRNGERAAAAAAAAWVGLLPAGSLKRSAAADSLLLFRMKCCSTYEDNN